MDSILRGPGELIAFLPYEIGFDPLDSLVVVGLTQGAIDVVARLDLDSEVAMAPGVERIGAAFHRAQVGEAMVCAFLNTASAVERTGPPAALLERVGARLSTRDIDAQHLLLITGGFWCAHRCGCGYCPTCPTEVPRPDRVDAVFSSVLRGVAPMASRQTLGQTLQCRHPALAQEIDLATGRTRAMSRQRLSEALRAILLQDTAVHEMQATDLAAIGSALRNLSLRDEVFGWVTPNAPQPNPVLTGDSLVIGSTPLLPARSTVDVEQDWGAAAVRARLVRWVQCLPDALRAPVLTLVAGSAWSEGSGAMASVAIDEALRIDPEYRLAQLLRHVVEQGVRPRRCA